MRYPYLLFLLLIGLPVEQVISQESKISQAQITFEFVSKEVKGNISGFQSDSHIDWEQPENSVFKGRVQSKTLDTNNGLRNWSLRSGKYFNVNDYPYIRFESTEVTQIDNQLTVKGHLTIKSITKPVSINFKRQGNALIGTFSLYSIDYGIKIKKKREDNLVKVRLEFEVGS